jgi:hypothetical protein
MEGPRWTQVIDGSLVTGPNGSRVDATVVISGAFAIGLPRLAEATAP